MGHVVARPFALARLPTSIELDRQNIVEPAYRTFVVIPTLITSTNGVRALLADLEVRYLANADPSLHFAVLSDFADSETEHTPSDDDLVEAASAGIHDLNARYGDGSENRFYLFHRHRVWSEGEQKWMGWERKRGKLHEFNRLLAGARDTTFRTVIGDESVLPHIRYVITLDSDTVLPRDAAARLIGPLAHPRHDV